MQWFAYSPLDTSTAITFPTCPASVLRGVQPGWDQTWGWGRGDGQKAKTQSHVCTSTYTRTYMHTHACVIRCTAAGMHTYTYTHTQTHSWREYLQSPIKRYIGMFTLAVLTYMMMRVWPIPSYNK